MIGQAHQATRETARSGVHPRGARDFFDALVALGLLDGDSKGRYANTSESDCYLVRGKPTYIGGLLRHLDERHYENWDRLCRALITGEPQSALGTKGYLGFFASAAQLVAQIIRHSC